MACPGLRIRELISVRTEGCMAMGWTGLISVHSSRPSHIRPDENEGLKVGVTTDSDMGMDGMFEGTQRGTLRKRALFGPGCCGSESPIGDVAEAQAG